MIDRKGAGFCALVSGRLFFPHSVPLQHGLPVSHPQMVCLSNPAPAVHPGPISTSATPDGLSIHPCIHVTRSAGRLVGQSISVCACLVDIPGGACSSADGCADC
jgi:hypothetical protein